MVLEGIKGQKGERAKKNVKCAMGENTKRGYTKSV